MPLITSMARRSLPKTNRLICRKRHKAAFLIILAIIGSIVVGKQVSNGNFKSELSRVLHGSYNKIRFERKYPGQEILSREAIVGLTNSVRAANGLAALSENQLLTAIAEERAK